MRPILLALWVALSLSTSPAFAADQTIDLSSGAASFLSTPTVLDAGDDVITFTLPAGTYNFLLSLSSQNILDLEAILNGQDADIFATGVFVFASLASVGDAPFVLTLTGTATGANSLYSGELTVSEVPEAGTFALLLLGLGGIGAVGRRR